jgi:hypothetical protein
MVKQKEKLFHSLSEKFRIEALNWRPKNPQSLPQCDLLHPSRTHSICFASLFAFSGSDSKNRGEENLTLPLDLRNVSIIISRINRIDPPR